MKLVDFRKLQSIDQRLPFWRARVKSTWNCTVYIEFYTWKSCIFHLENLEFSFEKSRLPCQGTFFEKYLKHLTPWVNMTFYIQSALLP